MVVSHKFQIAKFIIASLNVKAGERLRQHLNAPINLLINITHVDGVFRIQHNCSETAQMLVCCLVGKHWICNHRKDTAMKKHIKLQTSIAMTHGMVNR